MAQRAGCWFSRRSKGPLALKSGAVTSRDSMPPFQPPAERCALTCERSIEPVLMPLEPDIEHPGRRLQPDLMRHAAWCNPSKSPPRSGLEAQHRAQASGVAALQGQT